jgi:hypothetical protein
LTLASIFSIGRRYGGQHFLKVTQVFDALRRFSFFCSSPQKVEEEKEKAPRALGLRCTEPAESAGISSAFA